MTMPSSSREPPLALPTPLLMSCQFPVQIPHLILSLACETLTITICIPVTIVQLELICSGLLCLQGEGISGYNNRPGSA